VPNAVEGLIIKYFKVKKIAGDREDFQHTTQNGSFADGKYANIFQSVQRAVELTVLLSPTAQCRAIVSDDVCVVSESSAFLA
jgi:hypothetical protein